jgi:LPS-assembly protein
MAVSATIRPMLSCRWLRLGAYAVLTAALFGVGGWTGVAHAQSTLLQFPEKPPQRPKPPAPRKNEQPPMLLQATEMNYDYKNKRISAVGNVQIYHGGATLEANKVTYDETTKRLHAEGNVRLTEPDGKITYGEIMNLSDNFRDGFVDSLRLDSPDQTRMAATRADRTDGNFTVFQGGVYTACEPCKDDPKKPPLWQVTAARIVHDEGERMIYFENAKIEFFGRPIAYLPYFSAPDPTVKRKTGFLMPVISSTSKYGVGVETPYYWALAPDADFTFSPLVTTKQGLLLQGEYRQRLTNGVFSVRGSGIYQLNPDYFVHSDGTPTPGDRTWRGALETSGQFALNSKWIWGFDGVLPSDRTYFQDYNLSGHRAYVDPFKTGWTEGISQVYITGKGDRSFFDTRAIHYYGFSEADVQKQLPVIHPVLDYNYTFANPIFGGELGYRVNLTSLSRDQMALNPITSNAVNFGLCGPNTADPSVKVPSNCLLRGIPGSYTRASTEVTWKKSITDPLGQIFTPFWSLRADAATFNVNTAPGVSNYFTPGEHSEVRGMPTVGLEYRYPFINVQPWGTQTIEPIAQVIVRPNEQLIGKLPNEDAQSLIFDDSNLFRYDKFSGWDRVEGGGRANVGVQYTTQFNRAGFVNALFGQSYQLFGTNSFAIADVTNTGINSGLDSGRSDYVARLSYQPDKTYSFTTRYRFDEQSFAMRRFEAEARANYDRWNVALLYGSYQAQPELGYLTNREGILASTSIKLNANWVATVAARYDLDAHKFDQTQFGIGYIDDCFILGLNYITSYSYSGNPTADHRIMLQLSLRTIGGTSFGQSVGSSSPGGL